jgi:hypothetical protein
MGIRLAMEAADRSPENLTWRERYALDVLAMSAIDETRECPPGIEDKPHIIRRLRLGRSERYAVIASLVAKGALLRLERGRNGVQAVYAIAPFVVIPGSERPGDPDAPPVDKSAKGPGIPDASVSAKGPGSAAEGSGFHPPKGPGFPDPAPYKGFRGVKTGGGNPPAPRQSPLMLTVPDGSPRGEGGSNGDQTANRDRQALAAEIVAVRPEWTPRSVLRALEDLDVAGRPWPIVAEAMRIVAADKATDSPGRLKHPGPWWSEGARRARSATDATPPATHEYDLDPATGLCRCKAPSVDKVHRGRHRRTA